MQLRSNHHSGFAAAVPVAVSLILSALTGALAQSSASPGPLPCGAPVEIAAAEPLYPMPEQGKWGFVNRSGEWVLKPAWDRALDFSEGRAVVAQPDGLWGVIDRDGEYVLEPSLRAQQFVRWEGRRVTDSPLKEFSEGCAAGVGETSGATPFFLDREGSIHWADGHPGALAELDVHEFGSFSEGKAWFRVFDFESDLNFGWIDAQGEIVIAKEYAGAGNFSEGRAPAASMDRYSWGFIDADGDLVFPGKWTLGSASSYSEGMALVDLGTYDLAYVDREDIAFEGVTFTGAGGRELADPVGIRAGGEFHDGLAPVTADLSQEFPLVYVRTDGTVAFEPEALLGSAICNDRHLPEFRNGLVRLIVANDDAECTDAPYGAELPSYEGAHYVYLDTGGEVVLRQRIGER